jgi:NAD(P)-dependent dehydrogenase (short-subunit alcohol dehydrogenase family)
VGYLDGKVIAITGAGRGIGRAVALDAAAAGARIVVADYGVGMAGEEPTSEVADLVVKEIEALGSEAIAVAGDVSDTEVGQRIVDTAVESWGKIDGVVCVAGILRERMLFNMSPEEWDDVIRVHMRGTFSLYRPASAVMRKQGSGTLIGFTSGVYALGSVAQANYAAAKAGIVMLTRSAALGLNKYGVTANCIAPVARTRMSENVPQDMAEMGDPEDIAPMVVFLLSDQARHITGQVYTVVGGKIAVWSQPQETRAMFKDGRWTPEEIEALLDANVGQEPMPLIEKLKEYEAAAAARKAAAAG